MRQRAKRQPQFNYLLTKRLLTVQGNMETHKHTHKQMHVYTPKQTPRWDWTYGLRCDAVCTVPRKNIFACHPSQCVCLCVCFYFFLMKTKPMTTFSLAIKNSCSDFINMYSSANIWWHTTKVNSRVTGTLQETSNLTSRDWKTRTFPIKQVLNV